MPFDKIYVYQAFPCPSILKKFIGCEERGERWKEKRNRYIKLSSVSSGCSAAKIAPWSEMKLIDYWKSPLNTDQRF
jgi:hypothetical protein